jgi:hypothetical protein
LNIGRKKRESNHPFLLFLEGITGTVLLLRLEAKEPSPPLQTTGLIFEGLVKKVSSEKWLKMEGGIPCLERNNFPDGIVDWGDGWKIGEFKFSVDDGKAFTQSTGEYQRLKKYAELIEDDIKYQGKPIKKIKVIFSSKEFAEKNQGILKRLFDRYVEIGYISQTLQEVSL